MTTQLDSLDLTILLFYLGGTLLLGLYLGRSIKTGDDFFLAGRKLPWWAIGMSLVATDIGGTDIIGTGGAAYAHGMAVSNFEWIGCIPAMIVASFIFVPFFYKSGITTIPEFMERRYNSSMRVALAACWLIFMACNLGIMLYASAKMVTGMLPWDDIIFSSKILMEPWSEYVLPYKEFWCIIAMAVMVGVYTFAGGLAAVVYTDAIQCAVMILGCLMVLGIGLYDVGGISNLHAKIQEVEQERIHKKELKLNDGSEEKDPQAKSELTSLILPVDTESPFPWTGIFFGLALVLSPAYWIGNQAIVQRSLGAKSEFDAKASYIWGAVLKTIIPVIVVVPGLIAIVKFPELKDSDHAYPRLVAELLPTGIRGLFLAAFVAALMSSIDSYLNSASTIVTNDFYKRFINRAAEGHQLMWVGRITTVVLAIWAILFALLVGEMGKGVYTIFQTLMAFFQGPALAILLTGVLWRRATGKGAITGFVTGVICSVSLFTLNIEGVYKALGWQPLFQIQDPFLYFSVWAFLVALGVHVVVSLSTKPEPEEKIAGLIYGRQSS